MNPARRARSITTATLAATIAVLLALSTVWAASVPKLVLDINSAGDSDPNSFTQLGSLVMFSATDDTHGNEMWRTDGTPAGTKLVKDINTSGDSFPNEGVVLGKNLYFTADDGTHGRELWKTDGTTAGTKMVRDINDTLGVGSNPYALEKLGSRIIFLADDGDHGEEPWRTDGTAKGTKLLKDINLGVGGSSWCCFDKVGDALLFQATDGSGYDLWRTTGTGPGTTIVESLGTSVSSSHVVAGSRFFFTKEGGGVDTLYVTDGTAANVDVLVELGEVFYLTRLGQNVFFMGNDGQTGREPWFSDGTGFGTAILADINPADGQGSSPRPWHQGAVNGLILFHATDGTHGMELWKTNGTPGGTAMVEDINPSGNSSDAAGYREVVGNRLYFIADDGTHGQEPWITDGTANGTKLLKDIVLGAGTSGASDGAVLNGVLYFSADTVAYGRELWRTNGTPNGTRRLGDADPGPDDSNPYDMEAIGGKVYFKQSDGSHGIELWKFVP